MRRTLKIATAFVIGVYGLLAFAFGAVFYTIPAATLHGAVYVGLTWPGWVEGAPWPQPIMPRWAFSFDPKHLEAKR